MYHNKGEEEEEYAEYPDREEYPLAGRYSQKDAAEGSFGAGRLMAGNEVQKPAAGNSSVTGKRYVYNRAKTVNEFRETVLCILHIMKVVPRQDSPFTLRCEGLLYLPERQYVLY